LSIYSVSPLPGGHWLGRGSSPRVWFPEASCGVAGFQDFLVLHGRQGGFGQLWMYSPRSGERYVVEHPEPAYAVYSSNSEPGGR
jgi:hypothetical protein